MTQDFPTCIQCGALPDSREVESCRFCSTPLPWSDWDLRSRRVVVLVPTNTMNDAIARVEDSSEYLISSLALKRSHIASRKWHRRQRSREDQLAGIPTKRNPEIVFYMVVLFIGLFAILYVLLFAPRSSFPFFLVVVSLSVVAISVARHSTSTAPRPRRQHRSHQRSWPKRKAVVAAGITELGAPRPKGKRRRTLVRDVHLRSKNGHERKVIAGVHLDLHSGDVGIATIRGKRLEAFDRRYHVDSKSD